MKIFKHKIITLVGAFVLGLCGLVALNTGNSASAIDIDIDTSTYGYGKYVVNVRGEGTEGAWDSDAVTFYYYPAYAELVKENDKYYIDVYYNPDDGSLDPETTGEVDRIMIHVYDANGNEVTAFSPIVIDPVDPSGHSRVELPFAENNLDYGDYSIYIYSYNRDGVQLSDPYTFVVQFSEEGIVVPSTADTGGLFQGTNISKTDYLVTGLIVFGIIAVAGVVFILQHDKKQATVNRSASSRSRSTSRRSVVRKATTKRRK